MVKKKRKKQIKRSRPGAGQSFFTRLKERWDAKSPVLKFVLGFGGLMILFYVAIASPLFVNYLQPAVAKFNASVSNLILLALGQGTTVAGSTISSAEFSISVALGCDAIEPCAIFASLILAFPISFRQKLRGLLFGLLFLLSLNIVRVISLYLVGRHFPNLFQVMHLDVWQVIFIFFAIMCWAFWIIWAVKNKKTVEHAKA